MSFSPFPSARWTRALAPRGFIVLLVVYVVTHYALVCARRPFWMDELVTHLLSTDPSLPHALDALAHGADGGGPLPFVAAWLAGRAGASGEFGFRLLSCGYVAVGLLALFGALRRGFGTGPVLAATGWTMCGSTLVLYQNSEFRFYALLLGMAALAVNRYARYFAGDRGQLWVYAGIHALLVLTHPFGLLYSGALAAAALAAGWLGGVRAWPLALAGAAGAAAGFGPWLPAFLRQTKVLVADSQLPRPGLADLARVYGQLAPTVYYDQETKHLPARLLHALPVPALAVAGAALLGGALGLGVVLVRAGGNRAVPGSRPTVAMSPAGTALLVLAVALVLVPAGGWVLARVGRPVFLHRYFIPSVLGFAILYAAGFASFGRRVAAGWSGPVRRRMTMAALAGGSLFAAWPLVSAARLPDGYAPLRGRWAGPAVAGVADLPVVANSPPQFWPLKHYGRGNRVWLVLDRELAFESTGGSAATEFNFSTVQAGYYPQLNITHTAEFLRAYPRFLVDDERGVWFQRRIQGAPDRFRVERPPGLPENAVLVTAIAPAMTPPPP